MTKTVQAKFKQQQLGKEGKTALKEDMQQYTDERIRSVVFDNLQQNETVEDAERQCCVVMFECRICIEDLHIIEIEDHVSSCIPSEELKESIRQKQLNRIHEK